MLALCIGIGLAIALALFARLTNFDKDRSFYPTVLIVIASYYVLFAFMAEEAILTELVAATAFSLIALTGAFRWAPLVGLGIMLHGVFDLIHHQLIANSGVPEWWPAFCGGVDIVLGTWVLYSTISRQNRKAAYNADAS